MIIYCDKFFFFFFNEVSNLVCGGKLRQLFSQPTLTWQSSFKIENGHYKYNAVPTKLKEVGFVFWVVFYRCLHFDSLIARTERSATCTAQKKGTGISIIIRPQKATEKTMKTNEKRKNKPKISEQRGQPDEWKLREELQQVQNQCKNKGKPWRPWRNQWNPLQRHRRDAEKEQWKQHCTKTV